MGAKTEDASPPAGKKRNMRRHRSSGKGAAANAAATDATKAPAAKVAGKKSAAPVAEVPALIASVVCAQRNA